MLAYPGLSCSRVRERHNVPCVTCVTTFATKVRCEVVLTSERSSKVANVIFHDWRKWLRKSPLREQAHAGLSEVEGCDTTPLADFQSQVATTFSPSSTPIGDDCSDA